MEKLEIRQNLVAEDGSYCNKNDKDWTDIWFINYDGNCFILDSQGFPIDLGKINMVPSDWFTLEELGNINIDHYPHLLDGILEVVKAIHSQEMVQQHPSIRVFDMLWGYYSNFIDNPVEMACQLEVPVKYINSFMESHAGLDVHWAK